MYISKYGSKLNLHYCEAQARTGKGWPLRRKTLKLKPLPRAYIKVGCHPPPTTGHLISLK